jgi:hypothetical protein
VLPGIGEAAHAANDARGAASTDANRR